MDATLQAALGELIALRVRNHELKELMTAAGLEVPAYTGPRGICAYTSVPTEVAVEVEGHCRMLAAAH